MRNISSTVMALAAMVLSSMTTYLTFFDARYTLTAAVAKVSGQINRGYSSNSEGKSIDFRYWVDSTLVVSNRGTRALVISDVSAVKSNKPGSCAIDKDSKRHRVQQYIAPEYVRTQYIQPFIVEPSSVAAIPLSMGIPGLSQEIGLEEEFSLEPLHDLWCLEWKVFDPNGKMHENTMPAFLIDVAFNTPEGEDYPEGELRLDMKSGPTEILKRGLF
ncbi:hypothetical protein [Hirschia litorea]|uniref:Uncharacterized protein n=1 Tax=Hirschia litorea TaxID=1199156 RepID=A0ABW2IIR1_9PROT